jgi:hypothetical protein
VIVRSYEQADQVLDFVLEAVSRMAAYTSATAAVGAFPLPAMDVSVTAGSAAAKNIGLRPRS